MLDFSKPENAAVFFSGQCLKPAWKLGLSGSWYTPIPLMFQPWQDTRRIRMATCPWPGCKEYTSVFSVNYDGSIGEPIVGWAGQPTDYIGDIWWDDRPWCWMATTFLDGTAGSNQTYTSVSTWNNSNNYIELIGAGGSGGFSKYATTGSGDSLATGGAGGGYKKHTNFTFAVPGTTQATYQLGAGGAAQSSTTGSGDSIGNGVAGGDTWFNGASYGAATIGAKGGGAGNGRGATAGSGVPLSGASNGGAGVGNSTGYNGGNSGSCDGAPYYVQTTGGGGAAGPGGAGVASANAELGVGLRTDGGNGGNGAGGAGGAGDDWTGADNLADDGATGTEWDATHGSGGGGGAYFSHQGISNGVGAAGAGGLYGGGGGSVAMIGSTGTSAITAKAGGKGLAVLTSIPPFFGSQNRAIRSVHSRR